MHHYIQQHRGVSFVSSHLIFQLQRFVGLTSDAQWSHVIDGIGTDSEFHQLFYSYFFRFRGSISNDNFQRPGIEKINKNPDSENGNKPPACIAQIFVNSLKSKFVCQKNKDKNPNEEKIIVVFT